MSQLIVAAFATVAFGMPGAAAAAVGEGESTQEAVSQARDAAEQANFDELLPLLEPVITSDTSEVPAKAHLLFALGLVFEAPDDAGEGYFDEVNHHIERALHGGVGVDLDPLLYPPKFIARVDKIHRHIEDPHGGSESAVVPNVFYFERHVEVRSRLPLFLPGGVGQFYDDRIFRGITFAGIQALGLTANVVGHLMVDSLRTSSGHIPSEDVARARDWQRLHYAGLATFAGGWIIGIIEANLGFEKRSVRIRSLDSPPKEIDGLPPSTSGSDLSLQLQWSAHF